METKKKRQGKKKTRNMKKKTDGVRGKSQRKRHKHKRGKADIGRMGRRQGTQIEILFFWGEVKGLDEKYLQKRTKGEG